MRALYFSNPIKMEKIFTFKITDSQPLSKFMDKHFSARTATLIKNTPGSVKLNGGDFVGNPELKEGDTLHITVPERLKPFEKAANLPINVIHKCEDYLVVEKPAAMPCIPTKGHFADNLIAALTYLYPGEVFRVVTRLDKDTSGLVLVALNAPAHEALSQTEIDKKYTAELVGKLASSVTVDAKIYRESGMKRTVDDRGKPSKTHFKVLSYTDEGNTLCECTLFTGRTHQIRVHSAYIGHPVVGDLLYGTDERGKNEGQKLECVSLSFVDPFSKENKSFTI